MNGIIRIIDANLNRLNEGLRVIEELLRFYFNDVKRTESIKNLRHQITKLIKGVLTEIKVYLSRNTKHDIGTNIKEDDEIVRHGVKEIFLANAGRVKESLRVVEEFLKLIDVDVSQKFEKIRYQFYDLERDILELFDKNYNEFYNSKVMLTIDCKKEKNFKKAIDFIKIWGLKIVKLRNHEGLYDNIEQLKKVVSVIIVEDDIKSALLYDLQAVVFTKNEDLKKLKGILGAYFMFGGKDSNGKLEYLDFLELTHLKNENEIKKYEKINRIIADYDEKKEIDWNFLLKNDKIILNFLYKNLEKNKNIIKIIKEHI